MDTSTLLWWAAGHERLSARAASACRDPDNEVFVSVVSLWEILTKLRIGKLSRQADVTDLVEPMRDNFGLCVLSFMESAAFRESELPFHRDPFDRMLVCQAIDEGLTLVTPDEMVRRYPVETLW